MTVPPPGLFSTMTDRLSTLPSLSDNKRSTESFAPPGANGTIRRAGRSGYSARTDAEIATVARTPTAINSFIMFRSLNPRPLHHRTGEDPDPETIWTQPHSRYSGSLPDEPRRCRRSIAQYRTTGRSHSSRRPESREVRLDLRSG